MSKVEQLAEIINEVNRKAELPFVTARFGEQWKEHAKVYPLETVVNIAWTQGRRAILLERAIESMLNASTTQPVQSVVGAENMLMQNAAGWIAKLAPEAKQDFIDAIEQYHNQFQSAPVQSVEEAAKEYAEGMMGIGQYSESWPYADKVMYNDLRKAVIHGAALQSPTVQEDKGEQWVSVESEPAEYNVIVKAKKWWASLSPEGKSKARETYPSERNQGMFGIIVMYIISNPSPPKP